MRNLLWGFEGEICRRCYLLRELAVINIMGGIVLMVSVVKDVVNV